MKIEEHLDYLSPGLSKQADPPTWPPDVFTVAASLLSISGAYCTAANRWPSAHSAGTWVAECQRIGSSWRLKWKNSAQTTQCPREIVTAWKTLTSNGSVEVRDISKEARLCQALLLLVASTDEASEGAGVPTRKGDYFDFRAGVLLETSKGGSTLCSFPGSSYRVLPKMHTPQSGFTLRSFSHHLALISGSEIKPLWRGFGTSSIGRSLNLLLLPWPKKIAPSQFHQTAPGAQTVRNMPAKFGFFEFQQGANPNLVDDVIRTYQEVSRGRKIDMVIMPELSITDEEYDSINTFLFPKDVLLVAGVMGPVDPGLPTTNSVRYNIPSATYQIPITQSKHHRWKLEKNQIASYGLSLDPTMELWEHIPLGDRRLSFVTLNPVLTICVLICEDLARPDPVGDVIRAVGPNLVIALLLDGPQMKERWSARYAAALADDPGSSVLTLTCSGMTKLSSPTTSVRKRRQGEIALWKDGGGKAHVIDIGSGDAAVLTVEIEEREEWTADGRSDGGSAGYPLLRSVEVVKNCKVVKKSQV